MGDGSSNDMRIYLHAKSVNKWRSGGERDSHRNSVDVEECPVDFVASLVAVDHNDLVTVFIN